MRNATVKNNILTHYRALFKSLSHSLDQPIVFLLIFAIVRKMVLLTNTGKASVWRLFLFLCHMLLKFQSTDFADLDYAAIVDVSVAVVSVTRSRNTLHLRLGSVWLLDIDQHLQVLGLPV